MDSTGEIITGRTDICLYSGNTGLPGNAHWGAVSMVYSLEKNERTCKISRAPDKRGC